MENSFNELLQICKEYSDFFIKIRDERKVLSSLLIYEYESDRHCVSSKIDDYHYVLYHTELPDCVVRSVIDPNKDYFTFNRSPRELMIGIGNTPPPVMTSLDSIVLSEDWYFQQTLINDNKSIPDLLIILKYFDEYTDLCYASGSLESINFLNELIKKG